MKKILSVLMFLSSLAWAQHSPNHVRHNMLLFGQETLFLSHLVYKQPHNFQVILQVEFKPSDREQIEKARQAHPNDQFVLLLNPVDISQLSAEHPALAGDIKRDDSTGNRSDVLPQIQVQSYQILYFDEGPLSLAGKTE